MTTTTINQVRTDASDPLANLVSQRAHAMLDKFLNSKRQNNDNQLKVNNLKVDEERSSETLANLFEIINNPSRVSEISNEMEGKAKSKGLSDKENVAKNKPFRKFYHDGKFSYGKFIDYVEKIFSSVAEVSNLIGAFAQITKMPDSAKSVFEKMANFLLQASFVPYGLSGMKNGIKKKNFYQTLGFMGETFMVWLGNLTDIYLIRGAATGTDQLWVATDPNLKHKYKNGVFDKWSQSLYEVPKVCWNLLKEFVKDPAKYLLAIKYNKKDGLHFESNGHLTMLSSFGSITASLGYLLTGKEKIFGPLRDLSAWGIDIDLFFGKTLTEKLAGLFFILESSFDFAARFLDNKQTRLFLNMLSHTCGRRALRLYKQIDTVAKEDIL